MANKKVHIFWYALFSDDGKTVSLGGVQTYIINLARVFNKLDYEVHFYRPANDDIDCEHYNIKMHGFKCHKEKLHLNKKIKETFIHYKDKIDKNNDIIIFAEDHFSFKIKGYRVISLQHGIYWDKPYYKAKNSKIYFVKGIIDKIWVTLKRLFYSTNADLMVCVDYNYVNWYRAIMPCSKTELVVIPNFTPIAEEKEKPEDTINIIFARRFVPFRGTREFGLAISKILNKYQNVKVTLAGWGSDEEWLHEKLDKFYNRVEFIRYRSEDSLAIHSDKHIAVIPTIGSEGTSLSLLEAMSSHCAVIGSDVGGITNIILDRYNGLMVPAGDSDKLFEAMDFLINNPNERKRMAQLGYDTVVSSFSYDIWESKWIKVINKFNSSVD